jgi:hypothetical protein
LIGVPQVKGKPPRGVGSEPGDRQDWQRISGKMRRKSMPVLSVLGALVGGDEVSSPRWCNIPWNLVAGKGNQF